MSAAVVQLDRETVNTIKEAILVGGGLEFEEAIGLAIENAATGAHRCADALERIADAIEPLRRDNKDAA